MPQSMMFLCCSVCVAVCCSVLQRVAACCSVLQRVAACSIITTDQGCCYHDQKKCQVEHLSQKSSFTCQSQKLTTISSTCICQNNNSHFNQTKKTFGYQCQECECPDVSVGNNFHWNFKKIHLSKEKLSFVNIEQFSIIPVKNVNGFKKQVRTTFK